MAGYIHWLAPQMPELPALLGETFTGARDCAKVVGAHLRVPEVLAQLWLGVHCALNYAEETGACSRTAASKLRHDCWASLVALGNDQARLIESERPSRRFLRVLLALIVQGKSVLIAKDDAKEAGMPQGCSLLC
jgi:hypothetical protein